MLHQPSSLAPRFTKTLTVNSKIELISPSIQFDVIDDWSATVGCDSATFDLVYRLIWRKPLRLLRQLRITQEPPGLRPTQFSHLGALTLHKAECISFLHLSSPSYGFFRRACGVLFRKDRKFRDRHMLCCLALHESGCQGFYTVASRFKEEVTDR